MGNRMIIHLDMDAFFPAVEQRESPQFHGLPVVVGADPKHGNGRGVVSSASYEARKYGVHSAMPISQAYRLCPEAVFLPVNGALYAEVSENIMKIIREFAPAVEQVSLDEAYLDVSLLLQKKGHQKHYHTSKYDSKKGERMEQEGEAWEEGERLARRLKQEIFRQEKLRCTCGIAPNKMIAKIACESAKPDGVRVVKPDEAEAFVEPLDVQKIPGIGAKTAQILRASELNTVADLKKLSQDDMQALFGSRGKDMYERVRGIDESPVVAERQVKSVGREHTFGRDTRDPELLIRTFEGLAKRVAAELQEQGFSFRTVTVVCRFSGFETHTKSRTFKEASNNPAALQKEAMKLFLKFIVEKQKPIRLIGVRAGV